MFPRKRTTLPQRILHESNLTKEQRKEWERQRRMERIRERAKNVFAYIVLFALTVALVHACSGEYHGCIRDQGGCID
jgi:cytochrome c-type biogenesis protein CcmH/NrfG